MKTFSIKIDPLTNEEYYEVYLRGQQLLSDPMLNKASSFTREERENLDLGGLLRSEISNIETQVQRSYAMFQRKHDDIEKYIFLQGLLNRNETLFYRLVYENLKEMVPIVYTPTVGQACLMLSHITRRYRGIYISPENISNIDRIFQSINLPRVYLIVVTDGERILGLGDLGSDGMGIPVGKVNLYVAAGGLHPACCLPITLDVGTKNEKLLNDPFYLGYRHSRLDGKEYDDFIERFVLGVKRNFPEALLQWEDFAKNKAFKLMDRYRDRILSFNDDIQGTGATALAALMTAMRVKKTTFSKQKFIIVGMGQAGSGIAFNIKSALKEEGLSDQEIREHIFALDQPGLLIDDMPGLEDQMKQFTQSRASIANWKLESPDQITLMDVVKNTKANVLVGVTAKAGLFSREILEQMAKNDERPVILSLSNPTSKSECTLKDVFEATKRKRFIASGSAFTPITDGDKKFMASQCNNMYVFPGVGLGALISKSTKVTYKMFLSASKALSNMVTDEQMNNGLLLPDIGNIREVSYRIAKAVAIESRDSGLGRIIEDDQLDQIIKKAQWYPQYLPFRPGQIGTI
jgi:malate dehydrogenase (oxaloacetate-decarboxylating)